jgi:hypothetical protein
MCYGVNRDRSGQYGTVCGVNMARCMGSIWQGVWGQYGLVGYKKRPYMGSVGAPMLQEETLYGVNKDSYVTRMYFILGSIGTCFYKE